MGLWRVPWGTFLPEIGSIGPFLKKTHNFSVEIFVPKFVLRRLKNGCFLPKNRAIFYENLQNFGNQLKPSKYTICQNYW